MRKYLLLILPLFLIGCSGILPPPTPVSPCEACGLYKDPATIKLCRDMFCSIARPTATSAVTAAPTATAVPEILPTAKPTALPTPIVNSFLTTMWFVNGFSSCNPCTDNIYCHCPNGTICSGEQSCHGDRTFWYLMPGFDLVPKGTGCTTDVCRNRDSQGTPCGGAPACDQDHLSCARTFMGCNGKVNDDPNGSVLKCSGTLSCFSDPDNYGFTGTGTIGQSYMICARPFTNPYFTADGRAIPVQGTGEHCISGTF